MSELRAADGECAIDNARLNASHVDGGGQLERAVALRLRALLAVDVPARRVRVAGGRLLLLEDANVQHVGVVSLRRSFVARDVLQS